MKFRVMGVIKYLDEKGIMLKIVGKKEGVIIKRVMSCPDNKLTLKGLVDITCSLMKVKPSDVEIPEHIKLSLQ